MWSNLTGGELANRCAARLTTVAYAADLGADRVRSDQSLLFSFLRHAGLEL